MIQRSIISWNRLIYNSFTYNSFSQFYFHFLFMYFFFVCLKNNRIKMTMAQTKLNPMNKMIVELLWEGIFSIKLKKKKNVNSVSIIFWVNLCGKKKMKIFGKCTVHCRNCWEQDSNGETNCATAMSKRNSPTQFISHSYRWRQFAWAIPWLFGVHLFTTTNYIQSYKFKCYMSHEFTPFVHSFHWAISVCSKAYQNLNH